ASTNIMTYLFGGTNYFYVPGGTFYPYSGNPAGFLTSSSLTPYALISSLGNAAYGDTNLMSVLHATNADNAVTAVNLSGNISGAQVTSGTVADARLSGNVAFQNTNNSFTGYNSEPGKKIYNIKSFGACGNGSWIPDATVTQGLTNVFSPSSPFKLSDVGSVIKISDAGALDVVAVYTNFPYSLDVRNFTNHFDCIGTITNFVNASNVIISAVAGNSMTNQADYGPDDSSVLQTAFSFVCLNGGGEIYAPADIYMFRTNFWDDGAWTNHHCSMIYMPPVPSQVGNRIHVSIIGDSPQVQSDYTFPNVPNSGTVFCIAAYGSNTNLYSFIDTRSFTNDDSLYGSEPSFVLPAPLLGTGPAPYFQYNGVNLEIANIGFQVAFDYNMSLLSLQGAVDANVHDCYIRGDHDNAGPYRALSGTNGWAIIYPGGGLSDCSLFCTRVAMKDIYNGIAANGVLNAEHLRLYSLWNSFVSGGKGDVFHDIQTWGCKNFDRAFGSDYLYADGITIGDPTSPPGWTSYPNLVVQTNSGSVGGEIHYQAVIFNQPNSGTNCELPSYIVAYPDQLMTFPLIYNTPFGFIPHDAANRTWSDDLIVSDPLGRNRTQEMFLRTLDAGGGNEAYGIGWTGNGNYNNVEELAYYGTKSIYFPFFNISGGYQGGGATLNVLNGINTTSLTLTNDLNVGGTITGNGSGLTNVPAASITWTAPTNTTTTNTIAMWLPVTIGGTNYFLPLCYTNH
ncbi:MAG: hypothetical protein KGL39_49065, partial [Patescibacteria group bacterium]|nr:hypothetical protein [Patescibacteria group bacterium]